MDGGVARMWSAIVPVKDPGLAKSRLLPAHEPIRPELAIAFLDDVLTALQDAPSIDAIVVVTSSERAARHAHAAGARVIADPGDPNDPLNGAIRAGMQAAPGAVIAIAADLPCLDGAAVEAVLQAACEHPAAFVPDAAGTGTTMLALDSDRSVEPGFGERSRARHAAAGATELTIPGAAGARARRDVDTEIDLWDAARIGVGRATQRVLDWSAAP